MSKIASGENLLSDVKREGYRGGSIPKANCPTQNAI